MPCAIRCSALGGCAESVSAAQASRITRIHTILSWPECANIEPIIMKLLGWASFLLAIILAIPSFGDDWPEWRGKGRVGEYKESGILETFPAGGLKVKWRTPIHTGYTGPA